MPVLLYFDLSNIFNAGLLLVLSISTVCYYYFYLSRNSYHSRYFQCLPKFGLFAPVHKVIRIGFPSTSPAKAKKSKRMAMGVSSLAHSPSSSSISSVSSVASSVGGRPSRAGLVSYAKLSRATKGPVCSFQIHYNDCTSFTFTFKAFGRCFYPKRLTKNTFVERDSNISLWYIKIRIEQVSAFIVARLIERVS